jgi:hypothetical protein
VITFRQISVDGYIIEYGVFEKGVQIGTGCVSYNNDTLEVSYYDTVDSIKDFMFRSLLHTLRDIKDKLLICRMDLSTDYMTPFGFEKRAGVWVIKTDKINFKGTCGK